MRPTDDQLRRFLAGTLPAAVADRVAAWVETTPEAADALARLERPDTLAAALADTPGERSTRPRVSKDVSTADVTGSDTDGPPGVAPVAGNTTADGPAAPPTRAGATVTGQPGGEAAVPATDLPAGYQLVGELGRGGMGVVYRARDLQLDREVAVKVLGPNVRRGSSAGVRFRDEARITGQLQHPGIPPVYRMGELPDGRPFLAMKLIKGRTLADLLASDPAGVNRLGVFEGVCQAVGYAHAHGVIHRDLKPGNVMVGSFGEVQVMDWGLAKVLGGEPRQAPAGPDATRDPDPTTIRSARASDTEHGSVLGTPAYMAPEQAIGAVDQLDRRTDVFGLGGILCVLLTGRPPYVAADGEATRQLAARAKLDDCFARLDGCGAEPELVALCKRCLSAEPEDRPADADVVARAVGERRAAAAERARRAEAAAAEAAVREAEGRKRRRVRRSATAAVVGVLVAGTAVSVAFGVEAGRQADLARGEKKNAEGATAQMENERNDAVAARNDLKAANERTERTLAKALLGPMALQGGGTALSPFERDALWELAAARDGAVGWLLLHEATRTRASAQRLRGRAGYLYHAVVGLDPHRRAEADERIARVLRDGALPPQLRVEVARVVADDEQFGATATAAGLLSAAHEVNTTPSVRRQYAVALSAVARRLPDEVADQVAGEVAGAFGNATDPWMMAVPPADVLGDPNEKYALAQNFAAVCSRRPPHRAVELLHAALGRATDRAERAILRESLVAACGRLPADHPAVRKAVDHFLTALVTTAAADERPVLAARLAAACDRLPADEAAAVGDRAADRLLTGVAGSNTAVERWLTAEALRAVGRLLPADEAAAAGGVAAGTLLDALLKSNAPADQKRLADGLAAVCDLLPDGPAAQGCERCADALVAALGKETRPAERQALAEGLLAVCRRLPADKTADAVLPLLAKAVGPEERGAEVRVLAAVCGRLSDERAAAVCAKAADLVLAAPNERSELPLVCDRLPPQAAADLLLTALGKAATPNDRKAMTAGLEAACDRLPEDDARGVWVRAADTLLAALGEKTEVYQWGQTGEALAAVCSHLPPDQAAGWAARATDRLLSALRGAKDVSTRQTAAVALAAVGRRLPADTAAAACATAADLLLPELERATHPGETWSLAEAVLAVCRRLPNGKAAEVAGRVAAVLADTLGLVEGGTELWSGNQREAVAELLGRIAVGLPRMDHQRLTAAAGYTAALGVTSAHPSLLPTPRPLPAEALVALLKHPFVIGTARRGVLDALELTYDREFADLWEFVAFAEKEHPDLDLLTPPKRPEKK